MSSAWWRIVGGKVVDESKESEEIDRERVNVQDREKQTGI